MNYVVYFDDGTMLCGFEGGTWGHCDELPDAHKFMSDGAADEAARSVMPRLPVNSYRIEPSPNEGGANV